MIDSFKQPSRIAGASSRQKPMVKSKRVAGNQKSTRNILLTTESETNDDGEQSLASKVMTRAVPTQLSYQTSV